MNRISVISLKRNKALKLSFEILFLCSVISVYPGAFRVADIDIVNFESFIYVHKTEKKPQAHLPEIRMTDELWLYLRQGLNYLEASGRELPPGFEHPGKVAFGPLGLSRIAVEDVFERFPGMSVFEADQVFSDPKIYESFAKCYADLLLRHYIGLDYWEMDRKKVFDVLERAWFLGPNLYKQGASVIASRERRANEFLAGHLM